VLDQRRATAHLLISALLVVGCAAAPAASTSPPTPTTTLDATEQPIPTATPTTATPSTSPSPVSGSSSPPASPSIAPSPTGLPSVLAWKQLNAPDGPGAREDQTWTVDPVARVAYMFGGRAGGKALDELWRYDLDTDSWTRLEPAAPWPGARFGHVAAWDEATNLVVWSGQQSPAKFFDDTWVYDPEFNVWQQLPANGDVPPARYGSCGGFAGDGFFWISHGFTMEGGRFYDTRAYDFARGRWFDRTPSGTVPVERCLHDCFFTATGQLELYGGQTNGVLALGDLWTFDTVAYTWTQQAKPPLAPRQLYALATLGGEAYFFGGGDINGGFLSDLWQLDVATGSWTQLSPSGNGPSARSAATLIADPSRNRLLLFGGKNADGELGDLWQLGAP
jgi:Galactose oxidase, central domain